MTKRDQQRWLAQVRRDLVRQVYGTVDAYIPHTATGADITKYGNAMIRKVKAAIRKIR